MVGKLYTIHMIIILDNLLINFIYIQIIMDVMDKVAIIVLEISMEQNSIWGINLVRVRKILDSI